MYTPINSRFLEPQSSLNSALRDAASVAEIHQAEEGEEEGALEIQRLEEVDEEEESRSSSQSIENGRIRGGEEMRTTLNGSKGSQLVGGIGGLSTKLSHLGSVAVEDFSEEEEMASTSDSEGFEAGELELIESALKSLRSVEGDLQSVEGEIEGSSSSNDLQDMQDVARLLKKVQAIKARKGGPPSEHMTPSLGGSVRQALSGLEDNESADIRQVVKAAAQTALIAAKTAETVVSSLDRNSQAMEALCKALTGSTSLQTSIQETLREKEEKEEKSKLLAIELEQTEITKSLVKQNRITHWVLGFIVVSSLIWRYGVVKFVKKVNNTISNPFQGFTDMFKGQKEQIEKDKHIKLPGLLDGEDDGHRHHTAEENEDGTFGLGGIFPGLSSDVSEQQTSQPRKGKAAKEKKDRKFDLRDIIPLPGLNRGKEAEQKDPKTLKAPKEDDRQPNFGGVFSGLAGDDEAKQHTSHLREQRKPQHTKQK